VSAESVALTPRCAECEAAWLPADAERWRAYLELVSECAAPHQERGRL